MAVALDTSSAWGLDNGTAAPATAQTPTTGAFSPAASSILICVVNWASFYDGNVTIATPTNTGTALTWNLGNNQYFLDTGDPSGYRNKIFWAYNTSAQSNITVSSSCFSTGYSGGSIRVYSFTGHDTSSQLDSSNVAGHTALVSSVAGGMLVAVNGYSTASTDLTFSASGNPIQATTAGYKALGAAGTYGFNFNFFDGSEAGIIIKAAAGGTAHTASASATATATGTAAMRNARVGAGSGTGTATGTGAASRGQSVTGSASVTASATAEMSSTQVIGASGTGTASGTAAGAVTALVTISGAGSATASATAGASSTQVFAGSATVTATGAADASIRPIVTVDGAGTITATGAGTASRQQTLAATATATASATGNMIFITQITGSATVTATATALALITTPGTLYGSAQKVAGLYGSSTKPTLTTRS